MMVTKKEKLNAVFAALSDPTRRQILERLSAQPEMAVTALARPIQMSLPAVSRHLRVLEEARLVNRERHGRVHKIRLNQAGLDEARKWMEHYAKQWEARFEAMDDILNKKKGKARS